MITIELAMKDTIILTIIEKRLGFYLLFSQMISTSEGQSIPRYNKEVISGTSQNTALFLIHSTY